MSTTHVHYVQQLLTHFDADPDRVAVVSGGVAVSAGELAEATRRAAAVMGRHGIGRSDVVAVLTEPNTAATLILRWAANLAGATAAHVRGMNAVVPDDELRVELQRALVSDFGARILAVDPANAARARKLLPEAGVRPVLAVLGSGGPDTVDLSAGSGDGVGACADVVDSDIAVITQTSGSSGLPKGVCWPFGVKNEMATSAVGRSGRTNLLITAPLTHSSGFGADDTLITGGMVVLHHGFDAAAVLRAVAEHRIGRLILGTPQVYALGEHPDRPGTDLSSLTELIYTGSPAAPLRLGEAREVFGPVLIQVYGTTETGVLTMLAPHDHDRAHTRTTVGRPLD
ncbi:AMP-binding protein, partial [Nocardia bovistercoris]